MDELLIIILVSILLIGGLFLVSNLFDFPGRRKTDVRDRADADARTDADAQTDSGEDPRWRSVKIAPGAAHCEYARILSGKVFLLSEAPPLPLVNCNETNCNCRYIHLDDRRSGVDRRDRLDAPAQQPAPAPTDRRRRGGRRAADLVT